MGSILMWLGIVGLTTYLYTIHGSGLGPGKGMKYQSDYEEVKYGGYLWVTLSVLLIFASLFIE